VPGEEPRRAPSTADPLLERRPIPEAGDRPGPVVVTPETLVPLPDELSFEVGAAVSRGTDTASFGMFKRLTEDPRSWSRESLTAGRPSATDNSRPSSRRLCRHRADNS